MHPRDSPKFRLTEKRDAASGLMRLGFLFSINRRLSGKEYQVTLAPIGDVVVDKDNEVEAGTPTSGIESKTSRLKSSERAAYVGASFCWRSRSRS